MEQIVNLLNESTEVLRKELYQLKLRISETDEIAEKIARAYDQLTEVSDRLDEYEVDPEGVVKMVKNLLSSANKETVVRGQFSWPRPDQIKKFKIKVAIDGRSNFVTKGRWYQIVGLSEVHGLGILDNNGERRYVPFRYFGENPELKAATTG